MRFSLIFVTALFCTATLAESPPTQAENRIAFLEKELAKSPAKPNLYTELAIALLRHERETLDETLLDKAQTALNQALKSAPGNLEAQKVQTALFLERHDFASALRLATNINEKAPDDVLTYGYIADADLGLGDYPAAEKAAQWMLDLRTNNTPGLLRGAEVREIFGDSEGALQFLTRAYQQTSPEQREEIASILTRMGEINLATGNVELAAELVQKALTAFPYYFALELQARVRCAELNYSDAAEVLHKRNQSFPSVSSSYAEAEALEHAGNAEQAKALFIRFEEEASAASSRPTNDNPDLVFYFIRHQDDPLKALRIATLANAERHDVWTLDALAMAYYATGNFAEARRQIEKALAPGIRDGEIFFHAAQINAALHDQPTAMRYTKLSLEANPKSAVSDAARELLAELGDEGLAARRKQP